MYGCNSHVTYNPPPPLSNTCWIGHKIPLINGLQYKDPVYVIQATSKWCPNFACYRARSD